MRTRGLLIEIEGIKLPVGHWADRLGLPRKRVYERIRKLGMDPVEALRTNIQPGNRKHGEAVRLTPEYVAWKRLKASCNNPRCREFKNYGGRGIQVFSGWENDYMAFLAHVGRRPSPGHSIDRFPDMNGNSGWLPEIAVKTPPKYCSRENRSEEE